MMLGEFILVSKKKSTVPKGQKIEEVRFIQWVLRFSLCNNDLYEKENIKNQKRKKNRLKRESK